MSDCPCDKRNPGAYPESALLNSFPGMEAWYNSNWGAGGGLQDPYFCQYYCCTPGRAAGGGCPDSRSLTRPDWFYFKRGIYWYSHGHDGSLYVFPSRDMNGMWQAFKLAYCGANFTPPVVTFPPISSPKQSISPQFLLNVTTTANPSNPQDGSYPLEYTSSDTQIATVFNGKVTLGKFGGNVTISAIQRTNCFPPVIESQSFLVYGITGLPTCSNIKWGQTLVNSIITGGGANLPGVFSWTNPDIITNVGTFKYSITFTPTDPTWGPFTAKIPVTTTNRMISSFTNANKIEKIVARSNTSPMADYNTGYNFTGMKGILYFQSGYDNLTSVDIQYLGVRDVFFKERKIFQENVYTGITPTGLSYLDLTNNALTTDAIDGILISMEQNAKKYNIKSGQIYLWGGSSGWNEFPSEKGLAARKELISPPSVKYSGILYLSGQAVPQTGVVIVLNNKNNYLTLTGIDVSGNILSIVNKTPPFEDYETTYNVLPVPGSGCLFIRNSNGATSGSFGFAISGAGSSISSKISGSFYLLSSGGKNFGNWRVGINRWIESVPGTFGESKHIPSSGLAAFNVDAYKQQLKYITSLKPNQTINIALINYQYRGQVDISRNGRIDIIDAAFLNVAESSRVAQYANYLLASRVIGPETFVPSSGPTTEYKNAKIGVWAYGHSNSTSNYFSLSENYRYSGCTDPFLVNTNCAATGPFGGSQQAGLLSPYPFDGNTVECPIDCITNNFGKDVILFFAGIAPYTSSSDPSNFFIDESFAYNKLYYPVGQNCGTTIGSSVFISPAIIDNFSVVEPNQGNVCSERSISRDHARII